MFGCYLTTVVMSPGTMNHIQFLTAWTLKLILNNQLCSSLDLKSDEFSKYYKFWFLLSTEEFCHASVYLIVVLFFNALLSLALSVLYLLLTHDVMNPIFKSKWCHILESIRPPVGIIYLEFLWHCSIFVIVMWTFYFRISARPYALCSPSVLHLW